MDATEPVAPPRLSAESVEAQGREIETQSAIVAMLEAFPGPAVVLNDRRQVVLANAEFRTFSPAMRPGHRPGDAIGCVVAPLGSDGCGTAEACHACGAGHTLTRLERGESGPLRAECLITRTGPVHEEAHEFEAGVSRLPGGWTLLALRDISGEKRRRILERSFLHDTMNVAGGLQGLVSLPVLQGVERDQLLRVVATSLVEELRHQQIILSAEDGELVPKPQLFAMDALCAEVCGMLQAHPAAEARRITYAVECREAHADRVLLRRVLINLIKNAVEAAPRGGTVELVARSNEGRLVITVSNPGEIPPDVRRQLFRRSFSTKGGHGRGLGTWSIRLLTERYLGGTVSFACADGITVFTVSLPA